MARKVDGPYKRLVGERMRRTREALGRSQRGLAIELGENPNTWNQYENGVRLIDPITLDRWCRLDRLPMEWIYTGDPSNLRYEIAVKVVVANDAAAAPSPSSSARRVRQKAAK